jgi:hypothetical protein
MSDAPKDGGWPTPCQSQEQADAMLAVTVYGTGSEFEAIQAKELKSMKGITDRLNDELQEARAENDKLREALDLYDGLITWQIRECSINSISELIAIQDRVAILKSAGSKNVE